MNDQAYHQVYAEDVKAALLFLFHAMPPKDDPAFPFQGIPTVLYIDNGPLAKSRVFHRGLAEKLGIEINVHETPQQGGRRRTAARAKGKVERGFRAVEESFETLFHVHLPETTGEANQWLFNHLLHENSQQHPTQAGSRIEVWARDYRRRDSAGCTPGTPPAPLRARRSSAPWASMAVSPGKPDRPDHARAQR